MSQVSPLHPIDAEEIELPITFPKRHERYKVTSPNLKTDLDLAPRMRVKLTDAIGYVQKMALDASGEENAARFTVILDSCVLEEE